MGQSAADLCTLNVRLSYVPLFFHISITARIRENAVELRFVFENYIANKTKLKYKNDIVLMLCEGDKRTSFWYFQISLSYFSRRVKAIWNICNVY